MKFKEQGLRKRTKIVSLPAIHYQRCDKAIFNQDVYKRQAVNYGKFDSIGKFEIKDFDTEEECLKQAEKLIHSKKKKGYVAVSYTHLDVYKRQILASSLEVFIEENFEEW